MAWWDNLWLNEGFASWMGSKVTAKFNPDWEVWLERDVPRDPTRRAGIPKETAMESDARSTTHPIQQPVANEAEAGSAFDEITYKKGQSFIRMLESFLGEEDVPRRHAQIHRAPQIFEHDHDRSLERARRSVRQTGGRDRGQLDSATGLSHRDGDARTRRKNQTQAGTLHD